MIEQANIETARIELGHHIELESGHQVAKIAGAAIRKEAYGPKAAHYFVPVETAAGRSFLHSDESFLCRRPASWTSRNCSCTFLARSRKSFQAVRTTRPVPVTCL